MRAVAILTAITCVAGAAALTSRRLETRDAAVAATRDAAAAAAVASARAALADRRDQLTARVTAIARNEELRIGLSTDAATLADQIASEGLSALRAHEVYAIGRSDAPAPLVSHGLVDAGFETMQSQPLVVTALADSRAAAGSGAFAVADGAVVYAVAPVVSRDGLYRGYIAVGERLGLEALSAQAQATLLLSDSHRALGHAGEGDVAALEALVGREAKLEKATATDATGQLAMKPLDLAPGLSLWVQRDVTAQAGLATSAARLELVLVWLGAVLLSLVVPVLLWRKRRQTSALEQWSTGETPPGDGVMSVMTASGEVVTGVSVRSAPGVTPPFTGVTPPGHSPPAALAQPDLSFGRYRLLDRLGAGGMAEVWTAVVHGAEGFRRPFVVKRIRRDLAANHDLVQQFIDEANLAARLVHSNIVPVFDFGNLGQEYFLAQEYVLGRDLGKVTQALAQKGRRLDPTLALYVTAEILKALDYAHGLTDDAGRPRGIVHRDISPNNVLVSRRGEVKLIDFGIAKSEGKLSQTEQGTVKGNVRFMAPEQARGESVDARADLFSLGATMFFALQGEALYPGKSQYELLLAAATGPTQPELARIAALPEPLGPSLARALSTSRDDRWPSAQAQLEALSSLVPGDAARRMAALIEELFGPELTAQELRFAEESQAAATEDETVQRLAPGIRSGLS